MATIKQGLWYQCKKSHPYFTEGNYYYAPSDDTLNDNRNRPYLVMPCERSHFGKGYRHWHIDGKVYKTKEKFIAALADFSPNVLPISHRPYQNTVARMKHEQEAKPKATVVDMPKR